MTFSQLYLQSSRYGSLHPSAPSLLTAPLTHKVAWENQTFQLNPHAGILVD